MSTGKRSVDFLVVGAQKSATTSLFKYLSAHPDIFMPPEKEVSFFSDTDYFERGVEEYLATHFGNADPMCLWGEASPQYMCFEGVPKRIASVFPDAKLIAILRHPVRRAYSHYRMALGRGRETRSFETCVRELLKRGTVCDESVDEERDFVMFGEYGRILQNYLKYFGRGSIKIVFMEELINQSATVTRDIYRFLGASDGFSSTVIGRQFHAGGHGRLGWLHRCMNSPAVMKPIRAVLPARLRSPLGFWIVTRALVKQEVDGGPPIECQELLTEYYREDVALLTRLFEVSPPWGF